MFIISCSVPLPNLQLSQPFIPFTPSSQNIHMASVVVSSPPPLLPPTSSSISPTAISCSTSLLPPVYLYLLLSNSTTSLSTIPLLLHFTYQLFSSAPPLAHLPRLFHTYASSIQPRFLIFIHQANLCFFSSSPSTSLLYSSPSSPSE